MAWDELLTIQKINRENAEREASEPPTACPIDGSPLDVREDGVRHCPMGNYVWPEGTTVGA